MGVTRRNGSQYLLVAAAASYDTGTPLHGRGEFQPILETLAEVVFVGVSAFQTRNWALENQVQILKGVDAGKTGIVCSIIKERNWCYVEGLNCIYKWARRTPTNPGFMNKVEKPLLVTTEVTLLEPSDMKPTGVEWRYDEDGNRVRVALRTGRVIPLSAKAQPDSEDFIDVNTYKTQSCDTEEKEVLKVTYKPSLKLFEDEIMDSMGIKEHRKRAPNFYY